MSNASKHCREITRRLKGTEQRAMSTMQTMVLGHEGRLESMRGWIEEIGTTSKKKWVEHFAHLKCMRLMERWLEVRIDSLLCEIATDVPLNVVNGEGSGVNETVE